MVGMVCSTMRLKLIRLEFDRTKYLKEAFWRSFPIIWICEKGRYGFENFNSWLNGVSSDFESFVRGYYQGYVLEDKQND